MCTPNERIFVQGEGVLSWRAVIQGTQRIGMYARLVCLLW